MSFTAPEFLLFLAAVLILYRAAPQSWRWAVLLPASYFFYACHNVWLLSLILITTLTSYLCALRMEKTSSKGKRRAVLAVDLAVCLGILFVFKYLDFALGGIFSLLSLFGDHGEFHGLNLILPMGISFYVFQTLSYTIDVYRGTVSAERHLGYFALFVVFFPQLVAGPIERPADLLPQLRRSPDPKAEDISQGLRCLVRGYAKKVLIADWLARFVDAAYADAANAGGAALAAATVLFAVQIYCDFSGYSDIALGCARLMGVRLTENFRRPYGAATVRDFWRRWHISLTRWFTGYLYIPLGGSRKGPVRRCVNILAVFLVSGLWHGADVTFLIWGGLHGLYLAAETLLPESRKERSGPRPLRRAVTLALVCFAWIFFRAENLPHAAQVLQTIATDFRPGNALAGLAMSMPELLTALMLLALLPMLEALPVLTGEPAEGAALQSNRAVTLYFLLITAVVLCRCIALTRGGDTSFLYFQF